MSGERPAEIWRKILPFAVRYFQKYFKKDSDLGKIDTEDFVIKLHDLSNEAVIYYSPSPAGFAAALSASASGDAIELPIGTLTGNYTMTAGVKVVGKSRFATILTGQITGADEASIENLSITRTANDANALDGVIGQASGTFRIHACHITVTQSGSGTACGVKQESAGAIEIWSTYLYGNSVGGDGYGSYRTLGAISIDGGATLGSTAAIYDP